MKPLRACILASLTLPIALACGGDDDPKSTETFSTSVPDATGLGALTSDQQTAICADLERFMSSPPVRTPSTELGCRLFGVFFAAMAMPATDAEARAACTTAYDECKKTSASSNESTCTAQNASCTASVAELKACINEYPAMLSKAADTLPSCGTLTLMNLSSMGSSGVLLSPACATLQGKCPGAVPQG